MGCQYLLRPPGRYPGFGALPRRGRQVEAGERLAPDLLVAAALLAQEAAATLALAQPLGRGTQARIARPRARHALESFNAIRLVCPCRLCTSASSAVPTRSQGARHHCPGRPTSCTPYAR